MKEELEKLGFKKQIFDRQRIVMYSKKRFKVFYDDGKPAELMYKSCRIDIVNPTIEDVKNILKSLKL
jgi:hypothetical protein